MRNIKPKAGQVYKIIHIHPQCSWYAEKHYFENRLMQCVETFDAEDAVGFRFVEKSDCPGIYHPFHAFCFHAPALTSPQKANKASEQEAA